MASSPLPPPPSPLRTLRLPNTEVWAIVEGSRSIVCKGTLQLSVVATDAPHAAPLNLVTGHLTIGAAFSMELKKDMVVDTDEDPSMLGVGYLFHRSSFDILIVLSDSIPAETVEAWNAHLRVLTQASVGAKIASFILKRSEDAASLICKGAAALNSAIASGADQAIEKQIVKSNATPSEVSEKQKRRLESAKEASAKVVRVSGSVVTGAMRVTEGIGGRIAEKIKSGGGAHAQGGNVAQAQKVLQGSIEGFEKVYSAGKAGLMTVGRGGADATVKVTTHVYGEEVGEATRVGADTALNVGEAALNVSALNPASLAKHTAKSTAKAVVVDGKL
ncbi:hypothetical protein TeGR_g11624 [Tetraparma gracilis]|uniref:Senescence domain-containing protein n=1 Tax=Tetraparma gracilis TaxID=2962635 RepID=A0ABQ6MQC0_9STRA|nr:hypothetical protein TeGR_g11624 [Tetraparma gracilis]